MGARPPFRIVLSLFRERGGKGNIEDRILKLQSTVPNAEGGSLHYTLMSTPKNQCFEIVSRLLYCFLDFFFLRNSLRFISKWTWTFLLVAVLALPFFSIDLSVLGNLCVQTDCLPVVALVQDLNASARTIELAPARAMQNHPSTTSFWVSR